MGLEKFFRGTIERPSPSDIVKEEGISFVVDIVMVNLTKLNILLTQTPKVWITAIPDTNSMDPGFDFGHNNILIAGANEDEHKKLVNFLKVGDIAVYQVYPDRYDVGYAIHRIVKIGSDKEGRYFRFKGDNNWCSDSCIVRDNMIKWLCIGTIF